MSDVLAPPRLAVVPPAFGDPIAETRIAEALLRAGNYAEGLKALEARKRHPAFARYYPRLPGQEWRRTDLRGRRLLVRCEASRADTIWLARYIAPLAARGARVILSCDPALAPLLAGLPAQVAPKSAPMPAYDLWVDQISLPRLFGTTPQNIPGPAGYLAGPAPVLGAQRRRIAMAWSGTALPDLPDVALLDPAAPPDPAVLAEFDLVIATDNPIAHLAGALGRPVFVLLDDEAHWRWMQGRSDSPWYASACLFRQSGPESWLEALASALAIAPTG